MKKIIDLVKKRGTTLFLRLALLGVVCVVLFFSSFMVVNVYLNWAKESPELAGWRLPIVFVISASVATFLVAVGQIWRLLGLIDKSKAFSKSSVRTMRGVKYCGLIISGLFTVLLPLVFHAAENDDAPGLILLYGTIFVVIPFVIAVLAGVAQKLFQSAVDIKKENDLTV